MVGGSLFEVSFRLCYGLLLPSLSSSPVLRVSVCAFRFFGSHGGSLVVGRLCLSLPSVATSVVNFPARGSRIWGFVPFAPFRGGL